MAGLNLNNMYLYYMIHAMVLADVHSFKHVHYVPLKTVNRHFELYEIVVFPTQLFCNTLAKFVAGEDYFAINDIPAGLRTRGRSRGPHHITAGEPYTTLKTELVQRLSELVINASASS